MRRIDSGWNLAFSADRYEINIVSQQIGNLEKYF
jgi:hypothetical protein